MNRRVRHLLGLLIALSVLGAAPLARATSAVPRCSVPQLAVSEGRSDGAAGHIMIPLHFRNASTSACTLYGYPGAAGLDQRGRQVEQAHRTLRGFSGGVRAGGSMPLVVLAPGQVGTARIDGSDVPGPSGRPCPELHGLLVTPPNDRRSVSLKHAPPGCRLQIHPVIKGRSGTQP